MRYLPHEACGLKAFFRRSYEGLNKLFKKWAGLNFSTQVFFESDDLWTFCVRAVLFLVSFLVFFSRFFFNSVRNFSIFTFWKLFFGFFFSEMGGKSEQGWISNGNPMETRGNLEKLSEGKVHILTRSATYGLKALVYVLFLGLRLTISWLVSPDALCLGRHVIFDAFLFLTWHIWRILIPLEEPPHLTADKCQ